MIDLSGESLPKKSGGDYPAHFVTARLHNTLNDLASRATPCNGIRNACPLRFIGEQEAEALTLDRGTFKHWLSRGTWTSMRYVAGPRSQLGGWSW